MSFADAGTLTQWRAETLASIHDVPAGEWDRCVGPDDVLVSHRHLAALEDSGVAAPANGFTPCHVILRDAEGQLVAAAPAYLKTHSKGEGGVDIGLQLAHERMAGAYYPKLQVEVPTVPCAGNRLLVRADVDRASAARGLVAALQQVAVDRGASSVQIGCMVSVSGSGDPELLREAEMAITESNTYVWHARGDTSFATYVGGMTSRRRQEIQRERRQVRDIGLAFRYFRGKDIQPEFAARFFEFYKSTYDRHGTEPLLNPDYFLRVFETMPEAVDLSVSFDGDSWVGALYSLNGPTRGHTHHWGQLEAVRYLHFEQVYYRSIERAFVTGLDAVDFVTGGKHKAPRGLRPELVMHALWFRDAGMREVATAACKRKTITAQAERAAEMARLPFAAGRAEQPS